MCNMNKPDDCDISSHHDWFIANVNGNPQELHLSISESQRLISYISQILHYENPKLINRISILCSLSYIPEKKDIRKEEFWIEIYCTNNLARWETSVNLPDSWSRPEKLASDDFL